MFRPLVALSLLSLAAAPAAAATYSARISNPAPARIAARDVLWACGAGECIGTTANSRPLVLCQGLAKQAGTIESFAVDGRAIAAEELARCNGSARAERSKAVAAAR